MGWVKREVKAFGKEFARQGSILLFGYRPKPRNNTSKKKEISGAQRQYNKAQRSAKRNGFK